MSTNSACTIFPYVVRSRSTTANPHGIFTLGNDLEVALLASRCGVDPTDRRPGALARVVLRDEIEALGIDPSAAYLRALGRLHDGYVNRQLPWSLVPGPTGRAAMVFHHRFLAASCMLLPELYEHASRRLGDERLRVVVPSRDRMIVLRADDCEDAMRLQRFVASVARPGARVDLSIAPFLLDPAGVSAVRRMRPSVGSSTAIHIDIEVDEDDFVVSSRTAA